MLKCFFVIQGIRDSFAQLGIRQDRCLLLAGSPDKEAHHRLVHGGLLHWQRFLLSSLINDSFSFNREDPRLRYCQTRLHQTSWFGRIKAFVLKTCRSVFVLGRLLVHAGGRSHLLFQLQSLGSPSCFFDKLKHTRNARKINRNCVRLSFLFPVRSRSPSSASLLAHPIKP